MKMIKTWLLVTLVTTVGAGTVYLADQQILRQSANDPQIQLAEDAAKALNDGQTPQAVVPASGTEIGQSLAPYLMVFDKTGALVASSATLNGQSPNFPNGVLATAQNRGENKVTWQPQSGVRSATVAVAATNYTVVAGRSLREVEKRENELAAHILAGYLATLLTSGVALALFSLS